eukprot:12559_1
MSTSESQHFLNQSNDKEALHNPLSNNPTNKPCNNICNWKFLSCIITIIISITIWILLSQYNNTTTNIKHTQKSPEKYIKQLPIDIDNVIKKFDHTNDYISNPFNTNRLKKRIQTIPPKNEEIIN